MKWVGFIAALLMCCLDSQAAQAGLFVCNNTGGEIAVAVGWFENQKWVSRGWYRVTPRNCGATLLGALDGRYYYYYADMIGSNLHWSGEADGDGSYFCTTADAFYIDSTSAKSHADCNGQVFSKLDVGDSQQYTLTFTESTNDPTTAALNCSSQIGSGIDSFSKCWVRNIATDRQKKILDCIDHTRSKASLAICINKDHMSGDVYKLATCADSYNESKRGDAFLNCIARGQLNEDQARVFQCAVNNRGDYSAMGTCAISSQLSPEQQRIFGCVAQNMGNYIDAGLCAAGGYITPEQSRIANCVLRNSGSYMQMGVCAAGSNLTPEQQVFANCAISSGGQPYAFAGCVGTQMTMNELQKCLTDGIGGSGCFGDNNTAVKFVSNAWKDVTEGPGPNNDLLGRDGFIGRKIDDIQSDITYGPGSSNDLVGRDGFVCQTFFGGC